MEDFREVLGGAIPEHDPMPLGPLLLLPGAVRPAVGGRDGKADVQNRAVGTMAGVWLAADEPDEIDVVWSS